MANEKVLNYYKDDVSNAINIMRGTPYGNPIFLLRGATEEQRDKCCEAHMSWALKEIIAGRLDIEPLRDNDMYCVCAPKRCHGNNYVKILSWCMNINRGEGSHCIMPYQHEGNIHAGGICLTHGITKDHSDESNGVCEPEITWAA